MSSKASGWTAGLGAGAAQPRLLLAAELLLCLGIGLALARLIYALITPFGPVGTPPAMASAPASPDALTRFDPFNRQAMATPSSVSSLDLVLLGTRVDQATARGSAIIALPDETQSSFAVGDEILPGVTLAAVAFDSVTLSNNGASETLFLDQSGPVPASTPASTPASAPASASMAQADAASPPPAGPPTDQLPRLGADLMATPRLENGRITGLVLAPKGSGAAFAAAGLQAGDVLISIAGTPVAALGDPAALVRRLDTGGLSLDIERGGRPLTLTLAPGGRQA